MNQKIYFYVYPSAFQNPGGGEILLLKTKEYLEKAGVEIKLFDMWNDRFKPGDLLHVFGSVKEALGLMETAKSKGVKVILSPIIWYNWQSSLKIAYRLKDRILCTARHLTKLLLPQFPSARKKMMSLADIILAGSHMEALQIERYFLVPKPKIQVIHYGVDKLYSDGDASQFVQKHNLKDFVLIVGRIEPRKNHLNLIRAMNQLSHPLVIIGNYVSQHRNYYDLCRKEAKKYIYFLGPLAMDSSELRSAYAACDTFVLPTWFETPGLAALEAALSGAKLVITQEGSTKEYFNEYALYINPANVYDIRNKIQQALSTPKTSTLKSYIQNNFLWQNTAIQTLKLYHQLVGEKNVA